MKNLYNKSYKIIFAIVLFAMLLISCSELAIFEEPTSTPIPTPTLTSEQIYAISIEDAIDDYIKWVDGSGGDWFALINEYDNALIIASALIYSDGGLWYCDMFPDECSSEVFIEPAEIAVSEAYQIKTKFGGLTPPSEVAVSHQQIIDCLDFRMMQINNVMDILSGINNELPDNDPCKMADLALEQLRDYSKTH